MLATHVVALFVWCSLALEHFNYQKFLFDLYMYLEKSRKNSFQLESKLTIDWNKSCMHMLYLFSQVKKDWWPDKNMLVRYIKTRYYWNWIEEREINSGHIKQFFNVLHIEQQYPPHPQILTVFITCSI